MDSPAVRLGPWRDWLRKIFSRTVPPGSPGTRPAGPPHGFRTRSLDFVVSSTRVTLQEIRLTSEGRDGPDDPETVARVLAVEDAGRPLDTLILRRDDDLYPRGPRLFALGHPEARTFRVEIAGPGAMNWRIHPPEVHQALTEQLAGYEEWYAARDRFYSESYFRAAEGESGYGPGQLERAFRAQRAFASAVLSEAPFRSSLEFGSAAGAMVRALRERGVDAAGVDLSEYAVGQADPSVRPFLRVGDFAILDDIEVPREAVIAQEVLEHIPPSSIPVVFRKMAAACTRWLFITVPCTPHPGFSLIDDFADLPADGGGNPVEGHLTQASDSWWIAQAVLAGFEFLPSLSRRIRRRWGPDGRWWNLFVFRPAPGRSGAERSRHLDECVGKTFERLRQCAGERQIGTGRLVRHRGKVLLEAAPEDPQGYVYYGPYLRATEGRVRAIVRMRATPARESAGDFGTLPVAHIEIASSRGIKKVFTPDASSFPHATGWREFRHAFAAKEDAGIQVKVYHTGIAEIEIEWPVVCETFSST